MTGIRVFVLFFCGLAAGCVQSGPVKETTPVAAIAPVATGEPVVLSGVAYTEADVAANPPPVGPSTADIVVPSATPNPAITSTPLPGSAPPVVAAPKAEPPASPGVIPAGPGLAMPVISGATPVISSPTPPSAMPPGTAVAGEYPNINVPPQQPGGQLLTPEERAKLISELNALAGRPTQQ